MATLSRDRERERRTVDLMIELFCRDHHETRDDLCGDCLELRDYARERLEKCPFGDDKPTCAKCPIHCYKKSCRERIQDVMRYSGPRMMTRHPVLAVRHLLDGRKPAPEGPPRRSRPNRSDGF